MLGWAYVVTERWVRAKATRLSRLLDVVPPWYVRRVAETKLRRTLEWVWARSDVQREHWQRAGIRRRDLRSADVLSRIPFMTAADLAASPETYFCVPTDQLIHVLSTSGTAGRAKKVYLTDDDLQHQMRMIGGFLRRLRASRVLAVFLVHDPTWSAGMIARRAVEKAGLFGLLSGTHQPVSEQIRLIREYDIDAVITTPSYLHQITLDSDVDVGTLGIRWVQLSGQPFSEAFRRDMESAWGAKLLDAYASTECVCGIASECFCRDGLHLSETDYWAEAVDPATAEPLADGEEGELVLTTLSRRGMPLVRYRTGDFASLVPRGGRCACGLAVRKMSRVRGRVDDMLIVGGGNNVYPDEFDRALIAVPGVSEYQLVLERDGYRDLLHLSVEVDGDPRPSRETLIEALLSVKNVHISHHTERTLDFGRTDVVPRGTLAGGRPKVRRIIDRRSHAATQPGAESC